MIKLNYKNFEESFIEKVEGYLFHNPATDFVDENVTMNDLYLDDKGNIVYLYSWRSESYFDKDSYQTIYETSDEKYAILISREQIKQLK